MSKRKDAYLPKVRSYYEPTKEGITSTSPNGDTTPLPNPVTDDIVVNNIATSEFDYTESLFDEGMDELKKEK